MCLALIAIGQHPRYPLIILSNRDEFYERASASAHYWDEAPDVFAGKDLLAGGTWLGVNKQGRFSLITNYRNPDTYNSSMQSRGVLVKNYLENQLSPSAYIKKIAPIAHYYNSFNLLVGTIEQIICFSNVDNMAKKLTVGLYGISNHLLDTPWFKVLRAKELFNAVLDELKTQTDPIKTGQLLFSILEDKTLAPDRLLPHTGVSVELEKSLSSIFVTIPEHQYGTRSSTLLLFEKKNILFYEKTFVNAQTPSLKISSVKIQ